MYVPVDLSKDRWVSGTTATGVEQIRASSGTHRNLGVLGTNWAGEFEFMPEKVMHLRQRIKTFHVLINFMI